MQCDRLILMIGLSFWKLSRWLTTDLRRFMIIPMLCVTIFVILVVWFLLPRVARIMIHTPTAISIFVCLSMVQLIFFFQAEDGIRDYKVTGVQTCALPIWKPRQRSAASRSTGRRKRASAWSAASPRRAAWCLLGRTEP